MRYAEASHVRTLNVTLNVELTKASFRLSHAARYTRIVVAVRVTRRNAFAAAAGLLTGGWRPDAPGRESHQAEAERPNLALLSDAPPRVFVLYRDLARFVSDPDPDRRAALRRALGRRHTRARAAFGPGLAAYLRDQTIRLGADDVAGVACADRVDIVARVRDGLQRARMVMQVDTNPPVFLILSRQFDGRSDGRRIFIGVNRIGIERSGEAAAVLAAHEFHHVVRAASAPMTTLIDRIVAEGLATACSRLAIPGRGLAEYLLYPPGQLACYGQSQLEALWRDLAADPRSRDRLRRSQYLAGGRAGPVGAPGRSGYYLGYLIAQAWLSRGVSLAELTRMPSMELWRGSGYAR